MTMLDQSPVDALLARASQEVDSGRLPGCALALALDGRVQVSASFGVASPARRFSVMSVTKVLPAALTWLLVGEGALEPGTRVAELVPEFAREGFDAVTVEHLLTHTAGFPRAPLRPLEGTTSEGRRARFARWRLDSQPGSRTEYSPVAAHWVLVEVLHQLVGQDHRDLVRDRLLEPLGLQALQLGVAPGDGDDVLDLVLTGGAAGGGFRVSAEELRQYDDPAVREVGVPGAGAVSTADDIALLYQHLLHDPLGLWQPAALADGTGRVRNALPDPWTGVPANRTLGLVVAGGDGSAVLREFGHATGPRAFGASGLGGQIAWADPDTGLSFCFLTNGIASDLGQAFLRSAELSTLAASCVPLVKQGSGAQESAV